MAECAYITGKHIQVYIQSIWFSYNVSIIMQSSNSLWMFPLESDIESAKQSEYYYYNTFYGSERAGKWCLHSHVQVHTHTHTHTQTYTRHYLYVYLCKHEVICLCLRIAKLWWITTLRKLSTHFKWRLMRLCREITL